MEQLLTKENAIRDYSQLTELFRNSCKPVENFKIGLEFEKLPVCSGSYKAVPYSGANGIEEFLDKYKNFKGMEEILSDGRILGLKGDEGNITIEPGSQTEFSINPTGKISDISSVVNDFNSESAILAEKMGIEWLGYGVQPVSTFNNIEVIPKKRYKIMSNYLPDKGSRAFVMMRETAGIQTSIDYESEKDAMFKLKVSLAISPIITAMFANSPVRRGKESGYKSYRALSWLDTDNDRCGLISKKIFEDEFSFSEYAEYLLDVPMFFIERDNSLVDMTRFTFREFLDGVLEGTEATVEDWELHMTTVFPDVRLKGYIEMRNCDSQRKDLMFAFPALAKGIMYNKDALNKVWELVKTFSYENIEEMRRIVPVKALDTVVKDIKIADLAKKLVCIAEDSLLSDSETEEDAVYLETLKELVGQGLSPADVIIKNWNGSWNRKVSRLAEYSKLT